MAELRKYENNTYDDPSKEKKEIINGKIYYMSGGTLLHAKIISRIIRKFNSYLDSSGKECEVYTSDLDIYLDNDNLRPDISIICDETKEITKGYKGAPDLIVEVASRNTRARDRGKKYKLYAEYGVKEYWLVEPRLKLIEQYVLADGSYDLQQVVELLQEDEFDDLTDDEKQSYTSIIKSTVFSGLEIDLKNIFLKKDDKIKDIGD